MSAPITVTVTTPTILSPRVRQVSALLDVTAETKATRAWTHNLPLDEAEWQIGLIVGPSGAGKSVLARQMWGDALVTEFDWGPEAIVDHFPEGMPIRDIVGMLNAVGLSNVPAWLRPYSTLSNGEAFRATMARSLAEGGELVVVDEFTSVVDRQVAKVASHAVQKSVRRSKQRFVAVTCHYDVEEWLQPDWIYDAAAQLFSWRSVQPHPPLQFEIHKCSRSLWPLFAHHHYLSSELSASATCFAAYHDGRPIAFAAYRHFPHAHTRNIKMGHRRVVLPDWQGIGLGGRLADWTGLYLFERGYRYRSTVAHPAMVHYYQNSPRWRSVTPNRRLQTTTKSAAMRKGNLDPRRLSSHAFEYVAPAGVVWGCRKGDE